MVESKYWLTWILLLRLIASSQIGASLTLRGGLKTDPVMGGCR